MDKIQLIDLVIKSKPLFLDCVEECNRSYRFGKELDFYKKIIDLHREFNDLELLLSRDDFIKLIYETLIEWNMNERSAELNSQEDIKKSIFFSKVNLNNFMSINWLASPKKKSI